MLLFCFCFSFCCWFLISCHCGQERCLNNSYLLKFVEACSVSWSMVCSRECSICTWKECVFWFFLEYNFLKILTKFNCKDLYCLIDVLFEISIHWCEWVVYSCQFLPLCLSLCFMYLCIPISVVNMLLNVISSLCFDSSL